MDAICKGGAHIVLVSEDPPVVVRVDKPTGKAEEQKVEQLPQAPPVPLATLDNSSIVEVRAGPDETPFRIHAGILQHHSAYFRAALSPINSFLESHSHVIFLPDTPPETLKLATRWLYFGRFADPPAVPSSSDCIALWVFGDAHEVPGLANAALDTLHELLLRDDLSLADVMVVWRETSQDAQLRRFVVEAFFVAMELDVLEEASFDDCDGESDLPIDFLVRLCRRLESGGRPGKREWKGLWRKMDLCQFHEHKGDERCDSSARL